MLLATIVDTSTRLAATRARSAKVTLIADLLRQLTPADADTVETARALLPRA